MADNTRQYDVVVSDGETLRSTMDELTDGLICTWDMVTEYGPAGGHPVVQVTGTDNALTIFEGRYNGDAGIV